MERAMVHSSIVVDCISYSSRQQCLNRQLLLMQQSHDDTNGYNCMYQEDISYVSPFVFLSHSATKDYFIDTRTTKGTLSQNYL